MREGDLLGWDREHVWHPYTSLTEPTAVQEVVGAEGVHLELADGRRVVDGMSSWWAAVHGYRHPALDAAVRDQLGAMSHVMFGGLTHSPGVRLAERLAALAPRDERRVPDRVFLADSGSVSVEVALKVALQYQRGTGHAGRTRFLALRGGYHGDTFGAMSVCDPVGGMHSMFADVLPQHVFAPRPPAYDAPGAAVQGWVAQLRALAERHSGEVAAIVAEPLLQGAGGMHLYPEECLRAMREVADEHGMLLVLDEIATGFGRTGTMFAAQAAGVVPDVMCVGKALGGGYLTTAAMLCTEEVSRGVSASESGVLNHGPTFMGNPLACAVALANLDLLAAYDWAGTVAGIEARLASGLAPLRDLPGVLDVRARGAVGVVQLDRSVDVTAATRAALDAGAWLRPFRDLIYTMPPYVCGDEDLTTIVGAVDAAVRASLRAG